MSAGQCADDLVPDALVSAKEVMVERDVQTFDARLNLPFEGSFDSYVPKASLPCPHRFSSRYSETML